ncbi:hypothetical protein DPMN_082401 [Dreissena polymorpha]|uniref:Uncharacterized protein n=1 Tax=Dreissena polymorpha TaxID=45954 RepID=A0A9D3Y7J9_DREPO|nr:hypothetical protein DPMN_082401 [Dreissena polymorpha]
MAEEPHTPDVPVPLLDDLMIHPDYLGAEHMAETTVAGVARKGQPNSCSNYWTKGKCLMGSCSQVAIYRL